MSVTGIRGILNNVVAHAKENAAKQGITETSSSNQPAPNRKLLTKRSNAVFKDPLPVVAEVKATSKHLGSRISDGTHQDAGERPSSAPSQQYAKNYASEVLPRPNEKPEHVDDSSELNVLEYGSAVPSVDIHVDKTKTGKQSKGSIGEGEMKENKKALSKVLPTPLPESVSLPELRDIRKSESQLLRDSIDLAHARSDHGVGPSEPEEYWDDEEEENYEDDGYATARSYRSRGDNTTGGATTVLFPKYTHKVKRELAIAEQVVKSSQTAEEVEDEFLDTSMVAEYGEDIFQYLREMEVRINALVAFRVTINISTDQVAPQRPLYGQSGRDSMVNAVRSHGLVGTGTPSILAAPGDFVPLRQLHRPIPVMQNRLPRQVTVGGCHGYFYRSQIRGDQLPIYPRNRLHGGWWLYC